MGLESVIRRHKPTFINDLYEIQHHPIHAFTGLSRQKQAPYFVDLPASIPVPTKPRKNKPLVIWSH